MITTLTTVTEFAVLDLLDKLKLDARLLEHFQVFSNRN